MPTDEQIEYIMRHDMRARDAELILERYDPELIRLGAEIDKIYRGYFDREDQPVSRDRKIEIRERISQDPDAIRLNRLMSERRHKMHREQAILLYWEEHAPSHAISLVSAEGTEQSDSVKISPASSPESESKSEPLSPEENGP